MREQVTEDPDSHPDAESQVLQLEARLRAQWQELDAVRPWTIGTARRAQRLLEEFKSILAGRDGRLARAARRQTRPWNINEEPLRGCISRLNSLSTRSGEIRDLITRVGETTRQLNSVREEFANDLPSAWDRWFTSTGLTQELIDSAVSLEEVDAIRVRIALGAAHLQAWRSEISDWIDEESFHTPDITNAGAPPLARLEQRYTLLLSLQTGDRSAMLRRVASLLRETTLQHLRIVAGSAAAPTGDPCFMLAADYATTLASPEMRSDEIAAYRGALAHYYVEALGRAINE